MTDDVFGDGIVRGTVPLDRGLGYGLERADRLARPEGPVDIAMRRRQR